MQHKKVHFLIREQLFIELHSKGCHLNSESLDLIINETLLEQQVTRLKCAKLEVAILK